MPQITINSATITSFGFSATMDIYNRSLSFNLLPFTTGPNLANRPVCFSVLDQDGVTLASIDFTAPQIPNAGTTTSWVLDLSSVNFSFLFQTYKIIAAIQDIGGQIYQTDPIYPNICQPISLTDIGYVPGMFQVIPDCINSSLTVKEITAMVYSSLAPTSVSKTGILNYPTGTIGALSFSRTPFSNNVIYTGQYNIQCTSVATYALGNDVYVLVSYITNNVFPITCANKMSDIVCCITKVQQLAIKNCNNAIGENAKHQLSDISLYVMNGMLKEISGQDAQFEVDYIRKYLSCDCGSASLSQSEFTPINPAVTSIVLNGVGGTSIPTPTTTGNTKTYDVVSNVYQVVKGNTGDLAFTIQINTSVANTVKYIVTFNYDTMAGYILTAIAVDPTLLAQLNSLVQATGVNLQGLNGGCVIDLTKTNYSLSQSITGSTLVTNIVINGSNYAAPSNLFANNPTAVAVWLNSLTLGTFSATVISGILTILSVNNTNSVSTLSFTSPDVTKLFQATNATLVQVLQAIINYLCGITDLQVALSGALSLCTFDYNGVLQTTNYSGSQRGYNAGISQAICNLANRINTLTGLTCAKLQAIFSDNINVSFNNGTDRYLSIVGGSCTTLTGRQQALALIAAINAYADVKSAYCAIDCSVPGSCPDISSVNAAPIPGGIGIYGVNWQTTTAATQSVTVKYRLASSTTYNTATTNLLIQPNGNVSGTSPFPIPGLTAGQTYIISLVNNCGGAGATMQITVPSGTVYSGSFLVDNIIYSICGNSPITLYSSVPFAVGVTMYQDAGLTLPKTGFLFISDSTGTIYNLNSATGVVGSSTGSNCSSGTPGTYQLGNAIPAVCSASPVTLYTNGSFAPGLILYTDVALTHPVTGNVYVVNTTNNHIFNLNSTTGLIGSDTGTLCTGTAILTLSFTNAGGSFLSFQANLSRPVDANTNINQIFSDGFNNGSCAGAPAASAQITATPLVINAGSTSTGRSPESTSGSWASANHYKMYNLIINGVSHVNGDVVTIGSYSVTIVLPSCI